MRYYSLALSTAGGTPLSATQNGLVPTSGAGATFTSLSNGQPNPNALNIEFDFVAVPAHLPQSQCLIQIDGVGLQMLGQSSSLTGGSFLLSAGMSAGLPLANPAQAGVIAHGQIYQGYGNWQGVEQTLNIIGQPGAWDPEVGIVFLWPPGATLASALATAFNQAFPGYNLKIQIASIVQSQSSVPVPGYYPRLSSFAQFIFESTLSAGTQATGNANYPGVSITVDPTSKQITVWDGTTTAAAPTQLAFQDLIGQPTWLTGTTISFATVLRADIALGTLVKFPAGVLPPYALTTVGAAQPNTPARSKSIFQGSFLVTEVHHFARFRDPSPMAWVTTFVAAAPGAA